MNILFKLVATLFVIGFMGTMVSIVLDTIMGYTPFGKMMVDTFGLVFLFSVLLAAGVGLKLLWAS